MTNEQIGESLLKADDGGAANVRGAREFAAGALERERRRVRVIAAAAVLLWLLAAAGVGWVIYVATFDLYPKQQQLMRATATGTLSAEEVVRIQAVHFRAVEICTRVVAASFVALTLAALCTVALVLVSRTATLRQISGSLAEISGELRQLRDAPGNQPAGSGGPPKG